MKKRAFTLVELLMVLGVVVILGGGIILTGFTFYRLFNRGLTQILSQATARGRLELIGEELRSARSTQTQILNNGNGIRFVIDPVSAATQMPTYTSTADDITREYYILGTDLMYDPDTSMAGNQRIVVQNIAQEGVIPYFQQNGDLVVITFQVLRNDAYFGQEASHWTTSVKLRSGQ